MSKQDLFIKRITSLIEQSGLTKEEDIKKFVEENLIGKNIDDLVRNESEISDEEMAISFISQAYEEKEIYEKITLIELALDYDKKSLEAYLLLSKCVFHPYLSKYFIEKGIKIGKEIFPKKVIKNNNENLLNIPKFRTFLSLYKALGKLLFLDENYYESILILEKLLKINPTDELIARDFLGLLYLFIEEYEDYKILSDKFANNKDIYLSYNDVYYSFIIEEDMEKSKYLLEIAKKYNPHVIKRLVSPNIKPMLNDTYSVGSIEEAANYSFHAKEIWEENNELISWLKQNQ